MVSKVALSEAETIANTSSLMDLPTELHMQIANYLTYPDALSLKHTNRHFKGWVYTGVNLKIEWLIETSLEKSGAFLCGKVPGFEFRVWGFGSGIRLVAQACYFGWIGVYLLGLETSHQQP